jgi:hypothetical protein
VKYQFFDDKYQYNTRLAELRQLIQARLSKELEHVIKDNEIRVS